MFQRFSGSLSLLLALPPHLISAHFTLRNYFKSCHEWCLLSTLHFLDSGFSHRPVILASCNFCCFSPLPLSPQAAAAQRTGPFVCLYVVVRHTHACTACPPVCVQPQTWTLAWIWFFKNKFIRISVFCQNVSQIKFMFPLKNIKQVVCCPTPLLSSVLLSREIPY